MKTKHIYILPIVLISLLTGIYTGLFRIGWNLPLAATAVNHGAIMVGSFIGTLICLEKTVSYSNKAALLVPLVNGLSVIFFIAGMNEIAYYFLLVGSAGLVIVYYLLYISYKGVYLLIMMSGALCYFIGNALLIKTSFYPGSVMWWMGFLFFTVVGERLELSRFILKGKTKQNIVIILLSVFVAAIMAPFHEYGGYIAALSMIGSGIWLLKYDMARYSLNRPGQSFYSGAVLISGYIWLIISGLFMAYGSYQGFPYDAALHVFFLGFVFSMIFAHAPVILPSILKLKIAPFSPLLYAWIVLLNLSLLLRISGVFTENFQYKPLAGLLNGIAILGFFINTAISAKFAAANTLPGRTTAELHRA